MYRKEVNEQSPLRILEASIHGGLGKGNLGVLMSRAGVGKTACLVQIGLDDLMRDRPVLHLALGHDNLDHVHSWYDALFEDMAGLTKLDNRGDVTASVSKNRLIQVLPPEKFSPDQLDKTLQMYEERLGFKPAAILIDGFDWTAEVPEVASALGALKSTADRIGAELWMTAQTHRDETGPHPDHITPPCEPYADLIDVALLLEPEGNHVSIRLLKDHDETEPKDTKLHLQCDTMRLVVAGGERPGARLPASACTLLSGAAQGAEAAFGECAERWGIKEVNYTFEGHRVSRDRGLVHLADGQLKAGDVSVAYVEQHMHRTYPKTPLFRRLLQSIWHQVNTAGEVFVVGLIKDDDTVKGGTGWAAELSRHLRKQVHVFDQERKAWFSWSENEDKWKSVDPPVITSRRFTGTGSRFLSDAGRQAIEELFERSFGKPRHLVG